MATASSASVRVMSNVSDSMCGSRLSAASVSCTTSITSEPSKNENVPKPRSSVSCGTGQGAIT